MLSQKTAAIGFSPSRPGHAGVAPRTPHPALAVLLSAALLTWPGLARAAAGGGLLLSPRAAAGAPSPASPAARPAPLVAAEITIDITGPIARTRLRQLFLNPERRWVEGVYSFPLPEDAALHSMHMVVGDKLIQGVVKEREAARQAYETARSNGRRAGLITQERENLFTTALANIAPKSTIAVELGYQELLRYDGGRLHLRFPTVVAPRYVPKTDAIVGVAGMGWGRNLARVRDAERITPPLRHPDEGALNPVVFEIRLAAGVPVTDIESASHAIDVTRKDDGSHVIRLASGAVPADRDFELAWRPATGSATALALFQERRADATYVLAMVQPPQSLERRPMARETIFVIDTSGSMSGLSIDGARTALLRALDRLGPKDSFNIIRF